MPSTAARSVLPLSPPLLLLKHDLDEARANDARGQGEERHAE